MNRGCGNCQHTTHDPRISLSVFDGIGTNYYRFCSLACFCLFVRSNWMESRSQGGAA